MFLHVLHGGGGCGMVWFKVGRELKCGGVWWGVVGCGGVWWGVVGCGGVWWGAVGCGGVWWGVVGCGGVWWGVVGCGGVWWGGDGLEAMWLYNSKVVAPLLQSDSFQNGYRYYYSILIGAPSVHNDNNEWVNE